MPKQAACTVFAMILAIAGCHAVDRRVDVDPGADFSRLRTYAWAGDDQRVDEPAIADPRVSALVRQRVRDAVDATLASKGYRPAAPADMLVMVTVGMLDRVWVTSFPAYGPAWSWHGRYRRFPTLEAATASTTTERTVAVDVFDAESRRPIWHGRITTLADTESERPEVIAATVSRILEPFPARVAP